MLDLSTWNLTIPVGVPATTITTPLLAGGYQDHYFQSKNGAIFFWAPTNGTTTSGSVYPRTELRETYANGQHRNWTYRQANNFLTATLRITQVPSNGLIAFGQLHSTQGSQPPVMLGYQYLPGTGYGKVTLAVRNTPNQPSSRKIVLAERIQLNQDFSYRINLTTNGTLIVHVVEPNGTIKRWQDKLDSAWATYPMFFKAGVYTLDNTGNETEAGAATFNYLRIEHR